MTLSSLTDPNEPPMARAALGGKLPQTWKPGDVANGHVLTAENTWVPASTDPPIPVDAPALVEETTGIDEASPQTWKPGDVANGHVLTAENTWVPASTDPPIPVDAPALVEETTGIDEAPPQTWKPGDIANGHVLTADNKWIPVLADPRDAAALEAYRQQALRYRESITGWKPLVIWYGLWMIIFATGSISALVSHQVGVFFTGALITGLLFLYTRYLFRGGTRRVWFFIF